MKITVECGSCGAGFAAPGTLVGQTVKCPRCGAPITVKAPAAGASGSQASEGQASGGQASGGEASGGGGFDLSSLAPAEDPLGASLGGRKRKRGGRGGSSMGSRAGGSAMGSAMGGSAMGSSMGSSMGSRAGTSAGTPAAPSGESAEEMDERLARLYGVYMNKELRTERKGKFTLGLGISLAVVVVGLFLGGLVVLNRDSGAAVEFNAGGNGGSGDGTVTVNVEDLNLPDPPTVYSPATAGDLSEIPLAAAAVELHRNDAGSTHRFDVALQPTADGQRMVNMQLQAALYRATDPAGPYKFVSRAAVTRIDGGKVIFSVEDAGVLAMGANHLHYRLIGLDGKGKRLLDVPPVSAPVVPAAMLTATRVTWRPVKAGADAPSVAVAWTVAAEGWEDVPLMQVSTDDSPDGVIDAAVPQFQGPFKTRTVLIVHEPTAIQMTGNSAGARWQEQYVQRELQSQGRMATAPVGIVSVGEGAGLSYRLLPGPEAFERVDESFSGRDRVLSFRLKGDAAPQVLRIPAPPVPTDPVVTAFDQEVRLSWDNTALLEDLERYEGPIALAIYRTGAGGERERVGVVQPETRQFADTTAQPGQTYDYDLVVTRPGAAAGAAAVLQSPAWISGVGETPLLARVTPRSPAGAASPDPALTRLTVAFGRDELVYPETDEAAIAISDHLIQSLVDDPDVDVVHRKGLHWLRLAHGGGATGEAVPGGPAHVHLRLIDGETHHGRGLSLYATDLGTGDTRLLARTPADRPDAAEVARAVQQYLAPRRRISTVASLTEPEAPRRLLLGPILPADQPDRFWATGDLVDRIAAVAATAAPDIAVTTGYELQQLVTGGSGLTDAALGDVVVLGRAWNTAQGQPGLVLYAVSRATGRTLGRFADEAVDEQTDAAMGQWLADLRVPAQVLPGSASPLRAVEASLRPIHPVWQQAARTSAPFSMARRAPARPSGAVTVALGVPMPPALAHVEPSMHRSAGDPLSVVRPYVAHSVPLTFDDWTQHYAQWVRQDATAFRNGIERLNAVLATSTGEFRPHLIVRGEVLSSGDPVILRARRLSSDLEDLLAFSYLQRGRSGDGMVQYGRDFTDHFRNAPWRLYNAWGRVPRDVAVPVCQAVGAGVFPNRSVKMFVEPDRLPPLHEYAAAKICGDAARAKEFVDTCREKAGSALNVLLNLPADRMLASSDAEHARHALLILLLEDDPSVVSALRRETFRDQFLRVPSGQDADVLRLLVDRVGPSAWSWTNGKGNTIDWTAFRWRSPQEMKAVLETRPEILAADYRQQLEQWMDQMLDPGHTASPGPANLNANRR